MENNTRSFDYTRQVLGKLDQQARIEIERLGGNEGLTRFLDKMLAGMVGIESGDIVGSLTNGQSGAKAMV